MDTCIVLNVSVLCFLFLFLFLKAFKNKEKTVSKVPACIVTYVQCFSALLGLIPFQPFLASMLWLICSSVIVLSA